MSNAIVVTSGGLDSVTAAYYVKRNYEKISLLFFDYGQRCLGEELFCMKAIAKKLNVSFKVIDIRWLNDISTSMINSNKTVQETTMKDLEDIKREKKDVLNWYVPCRNALFLISALAHAESLFIKTKERYDIIIGIKKEGQITFKDSTPSFVNAINNLAEECTHHGGYKVIAPLIDFDKDEIVSLAQKLKVPLEFTYSCYTGSDFKNGLPVHCGYCSNCRQRQAAFYWANVKDPSIYNK